MLLCTIVFTIFKKNYDSTVQGNLLDLSLVACCNSKGKLHSSIFSVDLRHFLNYRGEKQPFDSIHFEIFKEPAVFRLPH